MHFNPCGLAVDMARRPYTTACRFFSDSDQTVKIRWYPAKEPIECLPFPSKINSLDWSSYPENAQGVGEVYDEPRTYNGAKPIDYAHGLTPCEPPEVFRTGEVRDPDRPPQRYDEKGFPLCCLDRFTATGGILWDGTALVDVLPPDQPTTDCNAPTFFQPNQWYEWTMPAQAGLRREYWYWHVPAGTTVRVRAEILAFGAGFGYLANSSDGNLALPCSLTRSFWNSAVSVADATDTSDAGTDFVWWRIDFHNGDGLFKYRVRVDF